MTTQRIDQACSLVVDCPHSTPTWTSAGALVFRSNNIRNGRLDLTQKSYTTIAEYHNRNRRVVPSAGDLIITREAPMGEVALIPEGVHGCLGQRMVLLRAARDRTHPRFLLYALLSPLIQHEISTHDGTGSTVSNLRIPALKALEVPSPPLAEQKRIADALGALDDKIELNRQMNETLEAMARALFKSWFVDFDPVRAKMAGRAPFGMDAATAALFPSSLNDGLPIGWTRAPLREWADALSGGTPSKGNPSYWDGDMPWISPKAMTDIFADEAEAFVTPEAIGNGTRVAPKGATLVMVRGMGLHEKVRVSQVLWDVTFNQDVKALVPRGITERLLLLAMLDAQEELLGKVESSGHGTGKMPSEILLSHPITMPPPDTQAQLTRHLDALCDRIASARDESRTLAELRDLLLPKLLSGELRIRDAENAVEAVI